MQGVGFSFEEVGKTRTLGPETFVGGTLVGARLSESRPGHRLYIRDVEFVGTRFFRSPLRLSNNVSVDGLRLRQVRCEGGLFVKTNGSFRDVVIEGKEPFHVEIWLKGDVSELTGQQLDIERWEGSYLSAAGVDPRRCVYDRTRVAGVLRSELRADGLEAMGVPAHPYWKWVFQRLRSMGVENGLISCPQDGGPAELDRWQREVERLREAGHLL